MKIIKRFFCKHEYVLDWCRVIHGINSLHKPTIEIMYVCKKCGKLKKSYDSIGNIKKYPEDKLID